MMLNEVVWKFGRVHSEKYQDFFACTEEKTDWLVLMDESAFIFYFTTRSGISSKSYNFFGFAKQKEYKIQNDIIRSRLGAVPISSENLIANHVLSLACVLEKSLLNLPSSIYANFKIDIFHMQAFNWPFSFQYLNMIFSDAPTSAL